VAGEELLHFPADDVLHHADSTDAVADAVEQARSAVHEVTMDPQAYGQLCQFLSGLLSPIFAEAASTLADTGESLRETARHLRAAAADFAATDTAAADSIRDAGRPGAPPP
jgi:Excreted virulence factor EspC, type VII ESX diderm